ncbi:MAG: hypothetical protein V7637_5583 [Mycobacteriales bacterium]
MVRLALGVLGPLEVSVGDRRLDLPRLRLRALLALLAADAGRVISVGALIEGLWSGTEPPPAAERTVRSYVSRLRAALGSAGEPAAAAIVTRAPGYLLAVEPDAVDAARFERLVADARRAMQGGEPRLAADRLAAALRLWRGEPYGEFDAPALRAEAVRLQRVRLAAVQDRVDADLATGLGPELVAELEQLTGRHSGHERLWGQLMTALYRAGRQADALAAFQSARRALVEEAGVEPTPALLDVHRRVLAQDSALLPAPAHPAGFVVPNQLPAATRFFTGRDEQLARLAQPADGASTSVISAVDGMAGIGKTAVAVLAAHRLAGSGGFPDGTLFVDLHGYGGRGPTDPADALEALLRGLGVDGDQVPSDQDGRVGLYRSVTARRRVLIVLDNALDEAQVRPLLPGTPTCRVLVTSRRRLAGLDEADHVTLDTLRADEAARLFRAVTGPGRDLGDDTVVDRIVQACGLLPLAVRVAAARLRASPTWTGPALLARLQGTGDRLAELDDGERSVAAALTVSVRQLTADQRRAFAVLGLHPGVEYERYATAALLSTSAGAAGRLLAALERVNLLEAPGPGRYRFHDLVRAFAATTPGASPASRPDALDRLYDHYARTAAAAARLAYPYVKLPGAEAGARGGAEPGPPLPTEAAALAWLDAELPNLLAAVRHAADRRPDHATAQSRTLHHHVRARGNYGDAEALHRQALAAAESAADPRARITALNDLGDIHRMQGRYQEAAARNTEALQAARALGHRAEEVRALTDLGWVQRLVGCHAEAAAYYTSAVRLAQATGDPADALSAELGLGYIHYFQGRFDEALSCTTRARTTARAIGDRYDELRALTLLGWIHHSQGRLDAAASCWTEVRRAARATGNRRNELHALTGLGLIHRAQGRYGPAVDCHREALRIARAIGARDAEIEALTGMADVRYADGGFDAAAACYRQVLDLADELGAHNWQFEGWFGLGRTRLATGHPDLAHAAYEKAAALARDLDNPADLARAHDGLGHTHRALGRRDLADRHWRQALDILARLDIPAADDVTADAIRAQLTGIGH